MKHKSVYLIFISLLCFAFIFSSCEKRLSQSTQWRLENEKTFDSYADSTDFQTVSSDGTNAFVYIRKLKEGNTHVSPIATSRVLIHYKTNLLAGKKVYIDGNFDSETPARVSLARGQGNDLVEGLAIGLQKMEQGEESEIIVPWYLAYGRNNNGNVPGYSALKFLVRLDSIIPEEAK